ncbi:MAG: hypothetical protein BWY42_00513 [Candidatus Omnitrophica bacterium ADurb.Bin277]|jgi:F0F1-type ATP synthase assembly protein I|nr:MAG: hypothetical protein BWY42_00513 [Candidatus Omnitrophica bacterium ADurb.Bin277]
MLILVRDSADTPRLFRMLGLATMVPTILIAGPLACFLLGKWMINRWNLNPKLIMILVLLGLIASVIQTCRIVRRLYQENAPE